VTAMKTIRITSETLQAIRDLAILPFRANATQQDDGTWIVPLDDDVWQRLHDMQLPAETMDDTLTRIIRGHRASSQAEDVAIQERWVDVRDHAFLIADFTLAASSGVTSSP